MLWNTRVVSKSRRGWYRVRQIKPPDSRLAGPATAVFGYPAARIYRLWIIAAVLAIPVSAVWTWAAGDDDFGSRLAIAEFLVVICGQPWIPIFGQVAYGPGWVARSTWRGWKWVDLNAVSSLRLRPGSWFRGGMRWAKSEQQLELTDASGSRLRLQLLAVQNDTLFEAIRRAVPDEDRSKLDDARPNRWRSLR